MRGRNKKEEDPDYDPTAEEENASDPGATVPAPRGVDVTLNSTGGKQQEPSAATDANPKHLAAAAAAAAAGAEAKRLANPVADGESKSLANPPDLKAAATGGDSKPLAKPVKKKARGRPKNKDTVVVQTVDSDSEAGGDAKSGETPTISNKDPAPGFVSQSPTNKGEDGTKGEVENEEEEVEEEDPTLEQYTTFTLDEADSLNYHQEEDNEQPSGRNGSRFTEEDLLKFIPSTTNKYCLMVI